MYLCSIFSLYASPPCFCKMLLNFTSLIESKLSPRFKKSLSSCQPFLTPAIASDKTPIFFTMDKIDEPNLLVSTLLFNVALILFIWSSMVLTDEVTLSITFLVLSSPITLTSISNPALNSPEPLAIFLGV